MSISRVRQALASAGFHQIRIEVRVVATDQTFGLRHALVWDGVEQDGKLKDIPSIFAVWLADHRPLDVILGADGKPTGHLLDSPAAHAFVQADLSGGSAVLEVPAGRVAVKVGRYRKRLALQFATPADQERYEARAEAA